MARLIALMLAGWLIVSCSAQVGKFNMESGVTSAEEAKFGKICRVELLEKNRTRVPGFVRLIFHDCVGPSGCNGCIDVTNADNAGMQHHMAALEKVYVDENIREVMSRADFWMLCANEAIKKGLQGTAVKPEDFPYMTKYGRVDCNETSPEQISARDVYPSPHGNINATTDYFKTEFGLTSEETTALLGAHTLGRGHPEFSGFKNSWVAEEFKFDNQFYKDMLNKNLNWTQVNVNNASHPKYQYVQGADESFMMFTSDMVLVYDIDTEVNGKLNGSVYNYPNSTSRGFSQTYANNMTEWVITFSRAYTKMTEKVDGQIKLSRPQFSGPSTDKSDGGGSTTIQVTLSLFFSVLLINSLL